MMDLVAQRFGTVSMELGEGPLWNPRDQSLYCIDVTSRWLHRIDAAGAEVGAWRMEKAPGCFGWREQGMIVAFRNALCLADSPDGPFTPIEGHDIDFANERFNDGKVDRRGRFWIGSFNPRFAEGGGSLYRIDPDLSVHRMDSGVTMSNGMGWSPDDQTMYFADSRPGAIWCYDFDAEAGTVGERRCFLDYADRPGRPDGLTVDVDGFIWVAEVTAGRVARYAPDGRLDRTVTVPVSQPTSVIFGGSDYRTLFITSMRLGLSDAELAAQPAAGGLFTVACDTPGIAEPLFGG